MKPTRQTMPVDICELGEKLIPAAAERIRPHVRKTWLQRSAYYSQLCHADVYFKYENLQHTGSFKLRGALNKILQLNENSELVAASTGNHGKAVAYAAQNFGRQAIVYAPETAENRKVEAIRRLGATVRVTGSDCIEAESAARQFTEARNADDKGIAVYVSPYNDLQVIAGQGTIGWEICEQLPAADAVVASVGGGGMISGIAAYMRYKFPNCEMIGCSPENSKVMIDSMASQSILNLPSSKTLSDGTAGGVEANSITFPMCCQLIDQTVSVTEQEIAEHLMRFIDEQGMLVEGAAAVCLASLVKLKQNFRGKTVVVILCGANIGSEQLLHAKLVLQNKNSGKGS